MSENFRKSVVEEAKANYQEVVKFAETEATKKVQGLVFEKLDKLFQKNLNEEVTIKVDDEGGVKINHDGKEVEQGTDAVDKVLTGGEQGMPSECEMEEEINVTDENSPIMVSPETHIQEIQNMEQEAMKMNEAQPAAAPAADATPAAAPDATATPAPDAPGADAGTPAETAIKAEVDQIKSMLMQLMTAQGIQPAVAGGDQVEVVDDEAAAQQPGGAPAPAAAPAAAPAPVAEEFEIHLEDANALEEEIEIIDDVVEKDGEPVQETGRTLGHSNKRTGDRNLKMKKMEQEKGHHAPVTNIVSESDSTKIKAQYESRIDELIKENARLKNGIAELQNDRKEFETAFAQLREEFDGMQTFNGKMALVNKLLMSGGFSQNEKIKICEQFDQAKTVKDAETLYRSIIKEGRLTTTSNDTVESKLKQASTNAAPSSEKKALYESAEVIRAKQLAGITKSTLEE